MRAAGSSGAATRQAILDAGRRLIVEHGYEGMSLRALARAVGLQASSLYNHFATKQQLLFELVSGHMTDLLTACDAALAGADDPSDALAAFCIFHLRHHMRRKAEVFVINFELRSLEPENRAYVVGLRSAYEQRLIRILEHGQRTGAFRAADPIVTAYAIIGMLTHVCTWQREDGRLSEREIVELYTAQAFLGVAGGARAL